MAEMTLEGVDARPEDSAFALGRVHSIETMGTVDGPGIRFVVFCSGLSHALCVLSQSRYLVG